MCDLFSFHVSKEKLCLHTRALTNSFCAENSMLLKVGRDLLFFLPEQQWEQGNLCCYEWTHKWITNVLHSRERGASDEWAHCFNLIERNRR